MAEGDPYKAQANLGDSDELIIDGTDSSTGAIDVTELAGTGDANVYREVDDGSIIVSTLIEQPTDDWHSQKNILVVSQAENTSIRIVNTSGGNADYLVTGYEVTDGS